MMFNKFLILLVALLVLAPMPARATSEPDSSKEQPAAAGIDPPLPAVAGGPALTGEPWRLEELINEPAGSEQVAAYLLFTDSGDLMGFGGCNYFIGKYRMEADGKLLVSSLRATHRQCTESSQRETTLLTSLVMANNLRIADDQLTFLMNDSNLMQLRQAPDFAVAELTKQGKLLKVRKTRARKARSKKKKAPSQSTSSGKTATPKVSAKTSQTAKMPVKAN